VIEVECRGEGHALTIVLRARSIGSARPLYIKRRDSRGAVGQREP
jgi:hypothetical protein